MTETGNIENTVVSTDGVINARAGYKDTVSGAIVADALSDINITLASKLPTEAELNQLRDNEITFDDYIAGYKDMKIGTVNATQNVTRKVVNADANGSSIKGDSITINAVGDVGSENSALSFIPSKEVAIYTKSGGSIDVSSKYVLRHANNVLIRNKNYNSSMENAITEASEATVKNAQFREKTINKTDISLYAVPTVSDYFSNVVNGGENADITNIKGDLLNTENVFDTINTEVSVSVTENANESVFTGEL